MSWYLCTISAGSNNWELCRKSSTWGINTSSGFASSDRARKNDSLLFWRAGIGYVAQALVSEDCRSPRSKQEAPWLGGPQKFGLIIPFVNLVEFSEPILLRFSNNRQERTLLPHSALQRGFIPINDSTAEVVLALVNKS